MSNDRKGIRSALKSLFENDESFEAVKVYSNRKSNISQREELPSITIFTPNEDATAESLQQTRYIRKVQLVLEVRIDSSEDTDDILDDLLSKVEDFMLVNSNISGTVLGSVLQSTETEIGYDGNLEIGLGVLTYEVTYVS
jgi:hypothetical protein